MEVLQMFEKSHVLDPTSHFIHYARNRFQQIAFSLDETWQVAQLGCHVLGMKTDMKLLGDSLLESEIPFESAWRSDIHFCFFDQHSQVFLEVKIERKRIHYLGFCQPYQWWRVKDWTFQFTPWYWEVFGPCLSQGWADQHAQVARGEIDLVPGAIREENRSSQVVFFFFSKVKSISLVKHSAFISFMSFGNLFFWILVRFMWVFESASKTNNEQKGVAFWANSWGLAVRGSSINKILPVQAQLIDDSILLPWNLT